jgi:hypothetical protein
VQSGNALSSLLACLRTPAGGGLSTDPSAAAAGVLAQLAGLGGQLEEQEARVAKHSSWARLLTHPSTTGLLAGLDAQLAAARAVLTARRELWEVLAGWQVRGSPSARALGATGAGCSCAPPLAGSPVVRTAAVRARVPRCHVSRATCAAVRRPRRPFWTGCTPCPASTRRGRR